MQFRTLLLLLPAVLLAACSTPQVVPTPEPQTGYARGIDMANDSSSVVGELRGRPWLKFVARYYRDPASRWPALSANEAQRLSALGYKIVTVWEWHSSDPAYFTYATGYNDALSAVRQAKTVGQPPNSAIYFAVDFNARGSALYQVDQYFRGVNAGLAAAGGGRPEYKVGVYGSGAVCATIKGERLAQYSWLTGSTAWEGTAGYGGWNIKQAAAGARFSNLSFSHDANEARNDYGGFQLAEYASAAPAAAVVTAAAAAPAAVATAVSEAVTTVVPPPAPAPLPPAPPAIAAPIAVAAAAPPRPSAPPMEPVAQVAMAAPRPLERVAQALAAAPRPNIAAAEVAALAAAEPALPAARTTRTKSREAAEPEKRQAKSTRSERLAANEEHGHARTPARAVKGWAAKASVTAKSNIRTASAHAPAVAAAAPQRRQIAAALPRSHETEHKASAPHRSEARTAHLEGGKTAATRANDQPAERSAEQHRAKRTHHAADT